MSRQVSVVIPARNDALGLPAAVVSVVDQRDCEIVEVLLCVGPGDDNTAQVAGELADTYASVKVLDNTHGGIPQALNLALAASSTDVLVRVDARCVLPPGYIAQALATLCETGAGNVGAVQVPVGRSPVQSAIARAMAHRAGSGGAAYRTGALREKVDTAFLGVFRTDALRDVGGWDEAFARNEDAELNARLADHGHAVWLDPQLQVAYLPRSTLPALARQFWDYGRWRRHTIARHPQILKLRQLAAPVLVVGVVVSTAGAIVASPWFLLVPAAYVLGIVVVGLTLPRNTPWFERLVVPAALATMHFSWGAGFLRSVLSRPLDVVAPAPWGDHSA